MAVTRRFSALTKNARQVLLACLSLGLLLSLFSLFIYPDLINSQNISQLVINSVAPTLALFLFISSFLIFLGRLELGVWLAYGATIISMVIPSFLVKGFGYPIAILIIAATIYTPSKAFSQKQSSIAVYIGGFASLFVIGTDLFIDLIINAVRIIPDSTDLQFAQLVGIIIAAFLVGNIIFQYRNFRLNTKLLLLTIGVGLLTSVGISFSLISNTKTVLLNQTQQKLLFSARNAGNTLETQIESKMNFLIAQAQNRDIIEYLELPPSQRLNSDLLAEVSLILNNYADLDPDNIGSFALLDSRGIDIMDTFVDDIGVNKADRDYFITPITTAKNFISPIRYSPTSTDYGFYIAVPIKNKNEKIIGVLRLRIRSSLLIENINKSVETAGEDSYPVLLDEYNIILAHGNDPKANGLGATPFTEGEIKLLRDSNRILPQTQVSYNLKELGAQLSNRKAAPFFTSKSELFDNQSVEVAVVDLNLTPWKMMYVQNSAASFALVEEQTRTATLFAFVVNIIVIGLALLAAQTISTPVALLTQAAESIRRGDLESRVSISGEDEFKTLGEAFNLMATQLNQTLLGLERRVADRTAALENQTSKLAERSEELENTNIKVERRALQFQAIANVSRSIASVQNIQELLPQITREISEKFGFYHVGIFLIDPSNEYAVLSASNSKGGERMIKRGHRLKIGETGIVGNVTSTGRAKIALDTGTDATYFNNPDLPETRSEMALPLRLGGVIIGALDVQSTEPNAFSNEDIEILNILSQQVTVAIQNARLFEDTRRASSETQVLLSRYTGEQWKNLLGANETLGYRFSGQFPEKLNALVNLEETEDMITIPVNVRGQKIGSLGIRAPKNRKWTSEDLDIVSTIADRIAIATENARLLNETQKQASKEQLISAISAKISASSNIRSVLQTAVEELGRALPNSEVSIKLKDTES